MPSFDPTCSESRQGTTAPGRNRRLQAKSAFWRSPSVHAADLRGPLRVRFGTFPNPPANGRRLRTPDGSSRRKATLEIAVFYVAIGHSAPMGCASGRTELRPTANLFSVVRARGGPRPVWRTTPSLRATTPRLDGTHKIRLLWPFQ